LYIDVYISSVVQQTRYIDVYILFVTQMKCKSVYDTWWGDHCESAEQLVTVDEAWVEATMEALPGRLQREFRVPVYCNQCDIYIYISIYL